ncbi:hypothetical protein [Pelosinus fermentans]|uniref:hypothetical protein n=1 Tax=Pelosinus fermentans TaxID=365349 RepID=UPI001187273E|nr:hypothetical protein [Pelosinus fermentans]
MDNPSTLFFKEVEKPMISNRPVIGIDVAKDFCFYAAASPSGTPFLKPFMGHGYGTRGQVPRPTNCYQPHF